MTGWKAAGGNRQPVQSGSPHTLLGQFEALSKELLKQKERYNYVTFQIIRI